MRLRHLLSVTIALLTASPTLRAAELDAPPAGAFTIVVIPDTQGYDGRGAKRTPGSALPLTNSVFQNHTRWITENLRAQNIVFVTHVGDIVDLNTHDQWRLARECLDRLHGAVPYGLTVGNHDMTKDGDASLFQRYFPAERFREFPWYGGCFEPARPGQNISGNNANSFQLFSAGGLDFVHLNLECNAPDDVLAWADLILTKYAGRRALITTHMDLGPLVQPKGNEEFFTGPKGRMTWVKIHGPLGNSPAQMWEKLYSKHANIGFIFSGDQSRTTTMRVSAQGSLGNFVHAMLSDYTWSGPLRLYRFIPSENKVRVITFDTTKRQLVESTSYAPDRAEHQFSVNYVMSR